MVRKGKPLTGAGLTWRARLHPLSYFTTLGDIASAVAALPETAWEEKGGEEKGRGENRQSIVPILSKESWGHEIEHLSAFEAVLAKRDVQAEIIAFVRPQVDWLQSAWWQWFAWEKDKTTPEQVWAYLAKAGQCDWAGLLQKFTQCRSVHKVTARLYQPEQNVVTQFCQLLGVEQDGGSRNKRRNLTLSPNQIRLYRTFPWLRSPHGGRLDPIISKILRSREKPPNMISSELAHKITTEMEASNQALMAFLSPSDRALMEKTQSWWGDKGKLTP